LCCQPNPSHFSAEHFLCVPIGTVGITIPTLDFYIEGFTRPCDSGGLCNLVRIDCACVPIAGFTDHRSNTEPYGSIARPIPETEFGPNRARNWIKARLELWHSNPSTAVSCKSQGLHFEFGRLSGRSCSHLLSKCDLDRIDSDPRGFLSERWTQLYRAASGYGRTRAAKAIPYRDHRRSGRDAGALHTDAACTLRAITCGLYCCAVASSRALRRCRRCSGWRARVHSRGWAAGRGRSDSGCGVPGELPSCPDRGRVPGRVATSPGLLDNSSAHGAQARATSFGRDFRCSG